MERRTAVASLAFMVAGCAQTQALSPRTEPAAPVFPWGAPVTFNGLVFDFREARHTEFFTNWLTQPTRSSNFVIVDVTVTNKTAAPLPAHFQPIFRLTDSDGAHYDASDLHTAMINMQKPGRAAPGQVINPNTPTRREIVFEAARRPYQLIVIVPNRARVAFAGSVESRGPYFVLDTRQQLA